ncbi:hypothetical protein [Candidatus Sororendozoicomonas aggregata]|uniref:hypothetical protein n=1 Tax=Candidatus Sororendozoicomonas aggregata TaxID=3073239 RepID=UPI002ED3A5AF
MLGYKAPSERIFVGDLKEGDVIISHRSEKAMSDSVIYGHSALVARIEEDVSTHMPSALVLEIDRQHGLHRSVLATSNLEPGRAQIHQRVYRFKDFNVASRAVTVGTVWLSRCHGFQRGERQKISIFGQQREKMVDGVDVYTSGVYSITSLPMVYFGNACYGASARSYARKLNFQYMLQGDIPQELTASATSLFTGVTCTYLPIAVYQAVLGESGSSINMAVDARRALPSDLAQYLDANENWQFLGLLTKI